MEQDRSSRDGSIREVDKDGCILKGLDVSPVVRISMETKPGRGLRLGKMQPPVKSSDKWMKE